MPDDKYIQQPTPEQHEALHKIIDRLPRYSELFEDHSECQKTVTSLREMLASQGRVSEQHRGRVQELAAELEHQKALRRSDQHWARHFRDKWVARQREHGSTPLDRQLVVNLYDRYDSDAAMAYERVFNSVLGSESDPNPEIADDERDRWLFEQTWLSAISTVMALAIEQIALAEDRSQLAVWCDLATLSASPVPGEPAGGEAVGCRIR